MSINSFLKLVEIQTKVASVIPFTLGSLYALFHFRSFNAKNFFIMMISLLCIDMATTAINNYMDYKKAIKTHGFGYESHNAIVKYNLKESVVVTVILLLLATASTAGFLLFLNTNVIVLILGGISFLIGVTYSFGPIPISRTPFGELFSGMFMGFIITFIAIYIHVFDRDVIVLTFNGLNASLNLNLLELVYIFLFSIPTIAGISNIMLANNICDIEDDIVNKRYTLPIYIGKERALRLFRYSYYIALAPIIVLTVLRVDSLLSLIVLITAIPVIKNINMFYKIQTKKDTFILAVKNFVLMNVIHIAALGAALIFNILV